MMIHSGYFELTQCGRGGAVAAGTTMRKEIEVLLSARPDAERGNIF